MINAFKYKKITQIFRIFTVLFLFLLVNLPAHGEQFPSGTIAGKVTTYPLDVSGISCYSMIVMNKTVYISTNKGLLVFDGDRWTMVRGFVNCKMTTWRDTLFFLGKHFFARLKNIPNREPVIQKIWVNNFLDPGSSADHFFARKDHFYLQSGKEVFQISEKGFTRVGQPDSIPGEVLPEIFPGWKVQFSALGKIVLVGNTADTIREVNVSVNPFSEPVIQCLQDDQNCLWVLFSDKLKRVELFDFAAVNLGLHSIVPPRTVNYKTNPGNGLKDLEKFLTKKDLVLDTFFWDYTGNIWFIGSKIIKTQRALFVKLDGKSDYLQIPYRDYGLTTVKNIIPISDSLVSLEDDSISVYFNLKRYISEKPGTRVRIFSLKADKKIVQLAAEGASAISSPEIELDGSIQEISIDFGTDNLHKDTFLCFSTYMEGYDTFWSDWNSASFRSLVGVSSGHYTFHVKAKCSNGYITPECTIHMVIKERIWKSKVAWLLYFLVITCLVYVYWLHRKIMFRNEKAKLEKIIHERTSELLTEKAKTDELLANLLPKDTADELKNTGKATSQKYNMVTVLFSDIQGFTKIAEEMNPEKLIDELDNFFFHFDSVVEKYNIEKIKTIGDAYMCAGGIPYKNRTNPVEVVLAALEMQDYMKQLRQKNNNIWDLRIGIHTGAVIAGVVGHKRVSYDIWGDTVNTASRMESSGEAGKVNISGQTYEMVKDFFICEHRGKMPVKYKGDIDMYFVKAIRPELSVDLKVLPNKKFFTQLQLLRLQDLEEFILAKLADELPVSLSFHNSRNTKEIFSLVELIGRAENFTMEEILLTKSVALFLNIGYCINYHDHTLHSVRAAESILPKFKYDEKQVETIIQLIRNVDIRSSNPGKLESVLIDSCNNYIGRVDYLVLAINHFQEMKHYQSNLGEKDWFLQQIHLLGNFHFFTATANTLREVSTEEQIQRIKEYIHSEKK